MSKSHRIFVNCFFGNSFLYGPIFQVWGLLLKTKKHDDICFDAESIIGGKNGVLKGLNREYPVEIRGEPECSTGCPAGVNVKAYVNLVANRRFEEAVEVIRRRNPFPAVCGRVCTRPCENSCEQSEKGDSVSIRALKRYASDYELAHRPLVMEQCETIYNEKIAIIGAGPAGLSAGVDLIRMGYPITVFEAEEEPGGMLRHAIPPYRLPDRVLKREIDWIKGLGLEIKTGVKIDDPKSLFKQGYSAVLIATGAPKSFSLDIEGEEANGVVDALWFLHGISEDNPIKIEGDIVVIGGGSTAFDAARSAVRLGAKKVTLAYRRGIEEMPAEKEEIEEAQEEDVEILTLAIPKKVIVKNKKVTGVEFLKAELGEPDESRRKKPVPVKGSEFVVNADFIIPAIGAKPDVGKVGDTKITTSKGRIDVKEMGATSVKGVFAAGDVETGPSSVVEAVGRGHEAAKGINIYLRKAKAAEDSVKPVPIVLGSPKYSNSLHSPKKLEKKERVTSFNEVKRSLVDFEAVEEASRCTNCGPCSVCTICLPNCNHKQLVAQTENVSFLLKVPCNLSSAVTEKGSSVFKLESGGNEKLVTLHSLTPVVDTDCCIGCGRCEEVCAYMAIRNILRKDGKTVAEVDHDSCVSCSACVSVCPSGAISQGYMSDNEILSRLSEKKTPYKGAKALMSYWSTPSPAFGIYDGVVEIMSARKPSPSFLINALVRSGRGVLVVGPDEKTGSHYLPWEEHPFDVVQQAKNLLKLVGVSPDRIQYKGVSNETSPSVLLKEFSQSLDKKKLGALKAPLPKSVKGPLGESMAALRIMGANPDIKPSDDTITIQPVKSGGVAFFEGCLPMLHRVGETHKLFDLSSTRQAIYDLMRRMKIDVGFIEGFSCPSKGLLQTKTNGIEEIVSKITSNNLKSFKKANPSKLILGTPEVFSSFSKEKDFGTILSLPDELLKTMKKSKDFSPVKKTVAIHRACGMENDPFYETTKKLLELMPGITIVELNGRCEHRGLENLDGDSKEAALNLMKEAVRKGADMIACTSPYCESHLLLSRREGSWRSVDVEVTDVYKLLLSSLGGDI